MHEVRDEIDEIDRAIVALLVRRGALAYKMAVAKASSPGGLRDLVDRYSGRVLYRERQVLEKVMDEHTRLGGVYEVDTIQAVFTAIFEGSEALYRRAQASLSRPDDGGDPGAPA